MNIITDILPKVTSTYKRSAFDIDERIRPIFLKYGLYLNEKELEEALCAVHKIANVIGNGLIEEDVLIIVVEKEKAVIPINGIAIASLLTVPTVSVGENLKMIKLKDPYYNEMQDYLQIMPTNAAKTFQYFNRTILCMVGFTELYCRPVWFRFNNRQERHMICIAESKDVNGVMKYVTCTKHTTETDNHFFDKKERIIQHWYEDSAFERDYPGTD